jgi:hypothetical protein
LTINFLPTNPTIVENLLIVPVRSDAVATVLLAEWALTVDYFDGAVLDGPVPRFFAANPTEVRAALSADASKAYKDLQRIFFRLFITENIPACDAWNFVGNPRQIQSCFNNQTAPFQIQL